MFKKIILGVSLGVCLASAGVVKEVKIDKTVAGSLISVSSCDCQKYDNQALETGRVKASEVKNFNKENFVI